MAGVAGFEPTHGGFKARCLTAWRHPIGRRTWISALREFPLFAPSLKPKSAKTSHRVMPVCCSVALVKTTPRIIRRRLPSQPDKTRSWRLGSRPRAKESVARQARSFLTRRRVRRSRAPAEFADGTMMKPARARDNTRRARPAKADIRGRRGAVRLPRVSLASL